MSKSMIYLKAVADQICCLPYKKMICLLFEQLRGHPSLLVVPIVKTTLSRTLLLNIVILNFSYFFPAICFDASP
jgi:hypothetical protein